MDNARIHKTKKFNELCKKYNLENEKKEIQVMINFSKELNKQKKSSELQKKMNNYINNFIKNKQSFNKVKNNEIEFTVVYIYHSNSLYMIKYINNSK
jgi:hypothetical protein